MKYMKTHESYRQGNTLAFNNYFSSPFPAVRKHNKPKNENRKAH